MNLAGDVPGCIDAEEIGAGGYGRVYRARQPAFDRVVAVKILHGRLDDADTLRRFQRECQAIGAVAGHPNIVGVHDAGGTPSGHPYIVMPYLRRGSLAERLRRETVPWQQAVQIGIKIAGALQSAHQAGVLHRDIKPENILVSDYGEPQLADFGIAQRLGSIASTATAAALTPAQGAPELLAGERPSVASDVYGLASSLHTLLRGVPPFARKGEESVFPMLARIATEPPPDLREHGVPDAVARVIEHGMAKTPQERPATALAFGKELQAAESALGLPVTVLPLADADESPLDADDATRPRLRPPTPPGQQTPGRTPGQQTPGQQTPGQTPVRRTPDPGYRAPAAFQPPDVPGYPTPNRSGYATPAPPPYQPPAYQAPAPPVHQAPAYQAPGYQTPGYQTPNPPGQVAPGQVTPGGGRPPGPWAPQQAGYPAATPPVAPAPAPPRRRSRTLAVLVGLIVVAVISTGTVLAVQRLRHTGSGGGTGGDDYSARIAAHLHSPSELGSEWQVVASDPGSDQAFCDKPLEVGPQDRAIVTMRRASPDAVVSEQAARRPGGAAATLLASLRRSAQACTTWTATENLVDVRYTVATAKAAKIGDDSAAYRVTRSADDGRVHFVQVYVVQRDVLAVVSYGTVASTTDADVEYAVKLAGDVARRLASL